MWESLIRLSFDTRVYDIDSDDDNDEELCTKYGKERWIVHVHRCNKVIIRSIYNDERVSPKISLSGGIKRYIMRDTSPFKGCINVKILKLTSCSVNEETLIEVLHNCDSSYACMGILPIL